MFTVFTRKGGDFPWRFRVNPTHGCCVSWIPPEGTHSMTSPCWIVDWGRYKSFGSGMPWAERWEGKGGKQPRGRVIAYLGRCSVILKCWKGFLGKIGCRALEVFFFCKWSGVFGPLAKWISFWVQIQLQRETWRFSHPPAGTDLRENQ